MENLKTKFTHFQGYGNINANLQGFGADFFSEINTGGRTAHTDLLCQQAESR